MSPNTKVELDGGGVFWPEEGYLWAQKGQIALPNAATEDEARELLDRFNDGEFYCCGCQEWHDRPAAGQRFAGLYCAEAYEVYKAANSRACRICQRPIWDCYC